MPLDPQAQTLLDQMIALNAPPLSSLEPDAARRGMAAMLAARIPPEGPQPVARVEDRTAPGPNGEIPVRIYTPAGTVPFAALIYFHGGGWVVGDIETHDPTCRALANASGCVVISVDYRLAPEHRFPAAAEDAYAATRWAAEHAATLGIDPTRIAVGGDSAGGNLTAVVALMARDRGGPKLAFQLLIYPVTDCNLETASYQELAEGYGLTRASMAWFWDHYLPDPAQRVHPYASPLRASDLSKLPPALVITAGYDPLRDEGEAYAARLQAAGVATVCSRYEGMMHGFFGNTAQLDKAKDAIDESTQALRSAFAAVYA